MLLRTRVTIIALISVGLMAAGSFLIGNAREHAAEDRYQQVLATRQAALWDKSLSDILQVFDARARIAIEDQELLQALKDRDKANAAAAGVRLLKTLSASSPITRLDITFADGDLASSSGERALLGAGDVSDILLQERDKEGLVQDGSAHVAVVNGFPIKIGNIVVGAITYATDVSGLTRLVKNSNGSAVALVLPQGDVAATTDPELWPVLDPHWKTGLHAAVSTDELDGRDFVLIGIPVNDLHGDFLAHQVAMIDVTEIIAAHRFRNLMRLGGAVLLIALTASALWLSLRYAFLPLTKPLEILKALSRGDTSVSIGSRCVADNEVGQLLNAAESLRESVLALQQLRHEQAEQRRHHEGIIREEMMRLARAIDDDVEREVVRTLAEATSALPAVLRSSTVPEEHLEVKDLDVMATAFCTMSQRVRDQHRALRNLVAELREALSARNVLTALQQELAIAHMIQQSFLPRPLQKSQEIDIFGRMRSAREIGGDFFDFFEIDADRVAIAIGDVSGKGVPAALFSSVARTLLRAIARFCASPAESLRQLNDLLCEDNGADLFVTVFYAVLDHREGRLRYANGGHLPPRLIAKDGRVIPLYAPSDMALAALPLRDYSERELTLRQGERLFLFTDGLLDACNGEGEPYSTDRLDADLAGLMSETSERGVEAIMGTVDAFAGGSPQVDDITCVMLVYRPPRGALPLLPPQ